MSGQLQEAATQSPVIHWPYEGETYEGTLRHRFYRANGIRPALGFAWFLIVVPFLAILLYQANGGLHPLVYLVLALAPITYAASLVLLYLPGIRLDRTARAQCESWRERWRAFEADVARFRETQGSHNPESAFVPLDKLVELAPRLPHCSYNLSGYAPMPLEEFSFRGSTAGDDLRIRVNRLLGAMLQSYTDLGQNTVFGYANAGGRDSIVSITMLGPRTQVWSVFTVSLVNNTIKSRMETGYQYWLPAERLATGVWYQGDLASSRKWLSLLGVSGIFYAVVFSIPAIAPVTVPLVTIFQMSELYQQFKRRDRYHRLVNDADPTRGDAVDLRLIQTFRDRDLAAAKQGKNPKQFIGIIGNDQLADIESFRRELIAMAQATVHAATLRS